MQIKINGNRQDFKEEKIAIRDLLKRLNYTFPNINVKHKDRIIRKDEFENYYLEDGDEILVIHHMCGG